MEKLLCGKQFFWSYYNMVAPWLMMRASTKADTIRPWPKKQTAIKKDRRRCEPCYQRHSRRSKTRDCAFTGKTCSVWWPWHELHMRTQTENEHVPTASKRHGVVDALQTTIPYRVKPLLARDTTITLTSSILDILLKYITIENKSHSQ